MAAEEIHLNVAFVNVIWEPMKIQILIVIVNFGEIIMITSIVCLAMVLVVVVVENAFATKIVLGSNVNAILYSAVS